MGGHQSPPVPRKLLEGSPSLISGLTYRSGFELALNRSEKGSPMPCQGAAQSGRSMLEGSGSTDWRMAASSFRALRRNGSSSRPRPSHCQPVKGPARLAHAHRLRGPAILRRRRPGNWRLMRVWSSLFDIKDSAEVARFFRKPKAGAPHAQSRKSYTRSLSAVSPTGNCWRRHGCQGKT